MAARTAGTVTGRNMSTVRGTIENKAFSIIPVTKVSQLHSSNKNKRIE